ncbi:Domain of uncharacterised function (DUF3291) [Nocardia otitidiscaviarum]|uniref:Domain of uncharacterized function (DUF3291) n=1 Tax=Nocardia otitidiscaviarum TaxID=1823 RepID=A0A378YAG7_9NOCA|nr:DUF3291 domain-containing protein [Nocardia otitidiscaviarum]SUA73511.1 Domain of uncharacterised function (DUF3291) [Nocardia otitidiscaviarum]
MTGHHLAQLNLAILKHPLDDPRMVDFTSNLEPINALAESSPGFVWRLVDDSGKDATTMRPVGDDVIINLSVWESREALWDYVYRSGHLEFLRRRGDWFERPRQDMIVLWWIPAGHIPTLDEAIERLTMLRASGPSPHAFSLRENYSAADAQALA